MFFYPPEQFRTFSRVMIIFCMSLLFVLGSAEYFPTYADYANFINQAGLQRTRVEVLTSAMVTLEYRPQSEHADAVAKIETALPMFKQEQNTLLNDPAPDIQVLMQQAQPNYLALVTAAQTVVDNPTKPVSPIQVNIMINKHDAYRMTMNQVVTVLVQHQETSTKNLLYIKDGIVITLFVLTVIYWFVLEKRMRHVIKEEGLATGGNS